MVLAVEYPMTGGKAVTKMRAKTINHPPRSSRHDLAMGASHAKKRCEYTRVRIMRTQPRTQASAASARYKGDKLR